LTLRFLTSDISGGISFFPLESIADRLIRAGRETLDNIKNDSFVRVEYLIEVARNALEQRGKLSSQGPRKSPKRDLLALMKYIESLLTTLRDVRQSVHTIRQNCCWDLASDSD